MRAPARSGIQLGSATSILTVGADDRWLLGTVQSLGLPVLWVRHPLPACERIRVTRPIIVVVSAAVRPVDADCVAHAAAQVGARVVEAAIIEEGQLASVLRRVVDAVLAEQDVPQLPSRRVPTQE